MSASPRVVLGMPAYNRPDALPRTLESLLSQTCGDFALVIVDDHPVPETRAIVESYAREYPRIHYEANTRRLGMVGNWRKVFERSREQYPGAEFFAWVSDHDLWHARWLQEMVAVLDAHPEVVLAYPGKFRMLPDRGEIKLKGFETFGTASPGRRLRASVRDMLAGDMIYGLMRIAALERAGVFRHVVTPDRQVLLALSLLGEVKQVPEVLWYRERLRDFDIGRQRDVFFPDGAPLYIYAPSHLQHSATLFWDFAVRGRGLPSIGRVAGACYAATQLWCATVRQLILPRTEWRLSLERSAIGRRLAALLPAVERGPTRRRVAGANPIDGVGVER